jgi:hypothetical protein
MLTYKHIFIFLISVSALYGIIMIFFGCNEKIKYGCLFKIKTIGKIIKIDEELKYVNNDIIPTFIITYEYDNSQKICKQYNDVTSDDLLNLYKQKYIINNYKNIIIEIETENKCNDNFKEYRDMWYIGIICINISMILIVIFIIVEYPQIFSLTFYF